MRMSSKKFLQWNAKSITLLAMSGAGKTTLANKLPREKWFHYSGDYRIGTKYLGEAILDNIKRQAMDVPFLKDLLRSDSIYIGNNISIDNLEPISSFLGKVGNNDLGGLDLAEFKRRQNLHHQAEVAAMLDVNNFMDKANNLYGYKHFINDAGGSVCELDNEDVLAHLAKHSLIIYIKTSEEQNQLIINRAKNAPKPLYYRAIFLDEQLREFMREKGYHDTYHISPDDFVSWVFPRLFASRLPRYQAIADQYGYTLDASEVANVTHEDEFMQLIATAIDQQIN
jgi:shikimate kinase